MGEWPRCAVCDVRSPDHVLGCAAFACRGADLIKAERWRQIQDEEWTPDHDDDHDACELSQAATAYVFHTVGQVNGLCVPEEEFDVPSWWPWHMNWWKPSDDPIRNLVKAGALIAAEIDRLQRAKVSS